MLNRYRVMDKRNVALKEYDPEETGKFTDKEEIAEEFAELKEELAEDQEKLFAGKSHSVLVLFQGMDCSGKDGVVKKVLSGLNPQGFRAESFKRPTGEESAHDFLWRAHKVTPPMGYMTSFNRSYYEDVLITRVHGHVDEREALRRLKHIQNFEQLLADSGTLVIKIFLHISREFQLKKIQERMENPEKLWKFDPSDLQERRHWDEYVRAYEDVFEATGTKDSPWYIVPANHRWYRDYLVLKIITAAMRELKLAYPKAEMGGAALLNDG